MIAIRSLACSMLMTTSQAEVSIRSNAGDGFYMVWKIWENIPGTNSTYEERKLADSTFVCYMGSVVEDPKECSDMGDSNCYIWTEQLVPPESGFAAFYTMPGDADVDTDVSDAMLVKTWDDTRVDPSLLIRACYQRSWWTWFEELKHRTADCGDAAMAKDSTDCPGECFQVGDGDYCHLKWNNGTCTTDKRCVPMY